WWNLASPVFASPGQDWSAAKADSVLLVRAKAPAGTGKGALLLNGREALFASEASASGFQVAIFQVPLHEYRKGSQLSAFMARRAGKTLTFDKTSGPLNQSSPGFDSSQARTGHTTNAPIGPGAKSRAKALLGSTVQAKYLGTRAKSGNLH